MYFDLFRSVSSEIRRRFTLSHCNITNTWRVHYVVKDSRCRNGYSYHSFILPPTIRESLENKCPSFWEFVSYVPQKHRCKLLEHFN